MFWTLIFNLLLTIFYASLQCNFKQTKRNEGTCEMIKWWVDVLGWCNLPIGTGVIRKITTVILGHNFRVCWLTSRIVLHLLIVIVLNHSGIVNMAKQQKAIAYNDEQIIAVICMSCAVWFICAHMLFSHRYLIKEKK